MLNKHQQKTLATKAKLFEAAQRIFANSGFERATIDQIARRAGFSRGAFYAHFNNKEDLFFALVQQRASEQLAQLCSQLQGATEEQSRALIWELCKNRLRDSQWSLLLIEFKLYIGRRRAHSVKTAAKLQSLRQSMQTYSRGILPEQGSQRTLFEALVDGLCLQQAYNEPFLSDAEIEQIMRQAFDIFYDKHASRANRTRAARQVAESISTVVRNNSMRQWNQPDSCETISRCQASSGSSRS
jgi:AcrR family transcriptional regulator